MLMAKAVRRPSAPIPFFLVLFMQPMPAGALTAHAYTDRPSKDRRSATDTLASPHPAGAQQALGPILFSLHPPALACELRTDQHPCR